jgi:hypothetical protein
MRLAAAEAIRIVAGTVSQRLPPDREREVSQFERVGLAQRLEHDRLPLRVIVGVLDETALVGD